MSKVTQRGAVAPTMNITPLIDVVFLLIIFFMIVSKIVSDQTVEMIVPALDEPKTREIPEDNTVIVNVAPQTYQRAERSDNPLNFAGEAAYVQIGDRFKFPINDLAGVTAQLQKEKAERPDVEVLLRADGALYYEAVQPIMGAITGAGIETVNLVAYLPEE